MRDTMFAENGRVILLGLFFFLQAHILHARVRNVLRNNADQICPSDQFQCDNFKCIVRPWFCDGADDCGDASDESYCVNPYDCPVGWYSCSNRKRCIPGRWRCDGTPDCPDHSDESISCFTLSTTTSPSTSKTYIEDLLGVTEARRNLTEYFLNQRQPTRFIDKWGPNLLRTAMALYLADSSFFAAGNRTGEEIAYEVSLQLLSKLALKKKISSQELSLFVNALTVACINPRDFFGIDVVAELRQRATESNFTNPFTILTLCNAGETMRAEDVTELQRQFDAHHRPLWTDTQALVTMALACISSHSNGSVDERIVSEMVSELKKKQFRNGTVDNLKTTALVLQALLATDSYGTYFDLSSAVQSMLQEINSRFVPILDLYYVLPILNSMSLVNISSNHCTNMLRTDMEVLKKLSEKPDERIQVQFSVYLGDDMAFVRTWKLKVPSNYTFYQMLENIGSVDPAYKVQYSVSEGKPYVTGMRRVFDDAEDGMFWFLYTQTASGTDTSPKLREESPIDIKVKETEEIILWYRSRAWADY